MRSDFGKMFPACFAYWAFALMIGLSSILFSGCLYTTHHFNSGRILKPGRTAVTFGYGSTELYGLKCPDGYSSSFRDSTEVRCAQDGAITSSQPSDTATIPMRLVTEPIPKVSLSYRLGVRGPWGPFTGLEMGWQIEAPTNPGTVEFDLKFGLPIPARLKAHHSISAGWGVGMWADNSWFGEYAISRSFGPHALYGNYRLTRLATQPADLDGSFNAWKFESHRLYANQAALGLYYKMPDWAVLPDFITPQVNFTLPVVAPFIPVNRSFMPSYVMNFNFGFGWNF